MQVRRARTSCDHFCMCCLCSPSDQGCAAVRDAGQARVRRTDRARRVPPGPGHHEPGVLCSEARATGRPVPSHGRMRRSISRRSGCCRSRRKRVPHVRRPPKYHRSPSQRRAGPAARPEGGPRRLLRAARPGRAESTVPLRHCSGNRDLASAAPRTNSTLTQHGSMHETSPSPDHCRSAWGRSTGTDPSLSPSRALEHRGNAPRRLPKICPRAPNSSTWPRTRGHRVSSLGRTSLR